MRFIKNLEDASLSFDYEGFTYIFPKSKSVFKIKNDALVDYLKENVPLAFDFAPEVGKDEVFVEPTVNETKSIFKKVTFGNPSTALGNEENPVDGITPSDGEFYGPGLEEDHP